MNMKIIETIFGLLIWLLIVSCSSTIDKSNAQTDSTDSTSEENTGSVQNHSIIFGVPIHVDERLAIKELEKEGLLSCETVSEENGEFAGAVVEFAGVKFGLNKGFIFLTSRQDKQAIDSLVAKISQYYGEPDIDDNGEPEWNYYHWNLCDTIPDRPYIRIRPIHSEEGGLVMSWTFK